MILAIIIKDLHRVRLIHVIINGIGIAIELLIQYLIVFTTLGDVLDKVGNLLPSFVAPRGLTAPMIVEPLLYGAHLFLHSLFSIALHTSVEGCIDLQSIGIEVYVVCLRPIFEIVLDGFAEIEGTPIVGLLNGIVQVDGYLRQRVQFPPREFIMLEHIVQHDIATSKAILGVNLGIVSGRRLQQTHQHCRLLSCQILRSRLEVSLGCRFDAEGIAAKIHRIEIEGQDVLLAVHVLDLDGGNPFFRFHHQDA